jgi:hypothetical protein
MKNPGDTPNIFILDLPINFIISLINKTLGLVINSSYDSSFFLAINSLISVLSFTLNILYYYFLSCLLYYLFNAIFTKSKKIK